MNKSQLDQQEVQLRAQTAQFGLVALALLILIISSITFFHFVENWNWLDSYYFTIVTIATVGYGDIYPTTDIGKVGATIVIMIGIALFSTFATMLLKRRALKNLEKKHRNQ